MRYLAVTLSALLCCSWGSAILADEQPNTASLDALTTRPSLLDGPDGSKEALRAYGVTADISVTQFYQGLVSGDGNKGWAYGSKGDAVITLDGAKLGFWKGFSINVHQEGVWGQSVNEQGEGAILPVNTALAFPRLGGYDTDTSFLVTQNFGEQVSVTAGKFNMLDAAAKTPLVGGGGINTFEHIAFAAPVSGVTPPYIVGASVAVTTEPVILKLIVYDPRNAQDWNVVTSPFEKGETTSLSATFPVTIAGLMGYQSLRGVYSTLRGVDLAAIPQLILPPDIRVIDDKQGYWYFAYSFQQYLWQSKDDPKQGWGIFGQYAMSDGNPNPIHQSWYFGVGGSSFIPGRDLDLWGIACFQYRFSDDLKYSLAVLGLPLRDESGVEAFYNLAVTPWFRWTANVEYVQPGLGHAGAVFLGMRSQIKF